jgi:RimJ/RimL family protein N-acetyltransferase
MCACPPGRGDPAEAAAGSPGPAGPAADEDRVVLRDGSAVVIRPLISGDEATIAAWFEGLGPETRYARFLAGVSTLTDRTRSELARVDHRDREALTAVAADGAVVGIARYARLPEPGTAEVAVAVADRWRGRGIAGLLLRRIAVRARTEGIYCLAAVCLRSNTAILRLLSRLGPMTTVASDPGVVEVRIDLRRASTPGEAGLTSTPAPQSAPAEVTERGR